MEALLERPQGALPRRRSGIHSREAEFNKSAPEDADFRARRLMSLSCVESAFDHE